MTDAEYWRKQEREAVKLAQYYERIPEDEQKAEGARILRRDAAFYRRQAELAEREEAETK